MAAFMATSFLNERKRDMMIMKDMAASAFDTRRACIFLLHDISVPSKHFFFPLHGLGHDALSHAEGERVCVCPWLWRLYRRYFRRDHCT